MLINPAYLGSMDRISNNFELFSYWTFDETSGDLIDVLGGNDGDVKANVTRGQSGIINNSYYFNRTTESYILPSTKLIPDDVNNFSISVWVKPENPYSGTTNFPCIVGNLSAGSSNGWALYYQDFPTPRWRFVIETDTGVTAANYNVTESEYNIGVWRHFLGVFKDGEPLLYENGILKATGIKKGNYNANVSIERIGDSPNFNGDEGLWDGNIDELGLFDGAADASASSFLYNNGNGRTYQEIISY